MSTTMSTTIIAFIIFVVAIISFVLQKIPAGLTAVCASFAMLVTGIISTTEFTSPFGSDTAVMVIACMILGNAVFEVGIADIIGKVIVKHFSASRSVLLVAVIIIAGALSAFLSNTAVVAMFMPLLAAAAKESNGRITRKGTYMAVGIASIVGGNCTLSGSAPQMIAQGILAVTDGTRTLTFWELGKVGVPILVLLVLYYCLIGCRLQDRVFTKDESATAVVEKNVTYDKKKQILVMVFLVFCIIGFSTGVFSLGTVAAFFATLCILFGCISFEKAFKYVDWNTVLVLGGSMGLSTGLNNSGIISAAAEKLVALCGGESASPYVICVILVVLSAVLGNAMSHTATTAALTPLAISVAMTLGVNPITLVVAVVIGSNLAFATPIGTPPLTMTLSAGYRFTDYTIVGGIYNVLAVVMACILIPIMYGF